MQSYSVILNNSNSWDETLPTLVDIPLSFTEESARLKQNAWFFRCYFEYLNCKERGSSWFITLTFNDENLPRLRLLDYIETLPYVGDSCYNSYVTEITEDDVIPCFDQRIVRRFVKVLRTNLTRKGYDCTGMQYLICSEFGSHTQRPHHHGQLFFPNADIPESDLLDSLRTCWHYGFIGRSSRGLKIDGVPAIRYATKYVSKDMSFNIGLKFKRLHKSINEIANVQDCYSPKEFIHMLRDFMPRNVISHGLGKCYMKVLGEKSEEDLLQLCTSEKQVALSFDTNKCQYFSLPRYYINRLAYKVDKKLSREYWHTIVLRTDLGIKLLHRNTMLRIFRVQSKIESFNDSYLRQFGCSNQDIRLYEKYKNNKVFPLWCAWYRTVKGRTFSARFPLRFELCDFNQLTSFIFESIDNMKDNWYVVDYWYQENINDLVQIQDQVGGSTFDAMADHLDDLYALRCPIPLKQCNNLTGDELYKLEVNAEIEAAYQIFRYVQDCVFWKNEASKKEKRFKKEKDKHLCVSSMFNPLKIKNYSSYESK